MLGPKSKDSYPAEILTARKTEKYFGKDDIKIHYILHVDKFLAKTTTFAESCQHGVI